MEKVVIDPALKAVIGTFEGFLTFEEHKNIGNSLLETASKSRISKLLVDTSKLKVIKQETQKWIETDWFPRAAQSGIKSMAFLIPSDTFGKMSTSAVNQKAGPIEIQHFDNLVKAKDWIESK